jgi:hypothetical protein
VSDEPSNTASEAFRNALAVFTEAGAPSEESLRARLADDFTYEDRRRGPSFPNFDAESYPKFVETNWQTGAGRPEFFMSEILAVRGERYAAVVFQIDYGNGMLFESIHVLALDATLNLVQRQVDFDRDDVDGATAELDRLHRETDAS